MFFEEMLQQAKKLYGTRKNDDGNCTFCNSYVGNGYCNCIESLQINRIAQRINEKASTMERLQLLGINFVDLVKNNNVPAKYANATLNQYLARNQHEIEIKKQISRYQTNIIENSLVGKNLLLIGNFGTAKSLLLSALCNHCTIGKGLTAKYVNIPDVAGEVKDTFADGTLKTEEDVIKSYLILDYLFLDDIDKGRLSDFVKELFKRIISKRYDEQKPTCISSNVGIEELDIEYFGEATISRMVENSVIIYFKSENERLK